MTALPCRADGEDLAKSFRTLARSLAFARVTGDFCHSERSRGISDYLESENRDVSTALDMTKREELLINAKTLPIFNPLRGIARY